MPRAPDFWQSTDWPTRLLSPLATLYGAIAARRMERPAHYRPPVPVIAVGNFTAGGAGKTPTTLALARLVGEMGRRPAIVLRGYGGQVTGVRRVELTDSADDIGDEAIEAAAVAPAFVAPDRRLGVEAAARAGCDLVLFDDGFQNPAVARALSIVVVDRGYGVGNGLCLPAGPLRAPLGRQMARADALVFIADAAGGDRAGPVADMARQAGKAVFEARLVATPLMPSDQSVVAFAGIGRPAKLADTLAALGTPATSFHAFADHHRYSEAQARRLLAEAERLGARLVTTAKDAARLTGASGTALSELARRVEVLRVRLEIDDRRRLADLIAGVC